MSLEVRPSIADAIVSAIPSGASGLALMGRGYAGDIGQRFLHAARMPSPPSAADCFQFQSGDGAWWESSAQEIDIRSLGADPLGGGDVGPIIQSCLNRGVKVRLSGGRFRQQTTVNIPEGMRNCIEGDHTAELFTTQNIPLFKYKRATGNGSSRAVLDLVNLWVVQRGVLYSGRVVEFEGHDDVLNDDRLTSTNGFYSGFATVFDQKWCGGHFEKDIYTFNTRVYNWKRRASFIQIESCLAINGDFFVFGDDPLGDGGSNSIAINRTTSVFMRQTDMRLSGWDAVTVVDGGFDLGGSAQNNGAGQFASWFNRCSNVNLIGVYLSSNKEMPARIGRRGIHLENCNNADVSGCRIYNCGQGLTAINPSGDAAGHSISRNRFIGNYDRAAILHGIKTAYVGGNFFGKTVTGDAPFLPTVPGAPSKFCAIDPNLLESDPYSFSMDASSLVLPQVFNAPMI